MAIEIVMPKLGWTMEEGIMGEWLKADGDTIAAGDLLFTVESDKATNEIESFDAGILRIPPNSPAPGTTVTVGTVLAYLVEPDEIPPFEEASAPTQADPTASTPNGEPDTHKPDTGRSAPDRSGRATRGPAISPRARRVARELGIDWQALEGSGKTGRIVERDIRAAAQHQQTQTQTPDDIRISPVARRLAERLGVDVAALAATLPDRRITRDDVEQAVATSMTAPAARPPSAGASPEEDNQALAGGTARPLDPVRRVIVERMTASAHTTAPVTLTTEVDATELVRLRESLKAGAAHLHGPVPAYNDLLARLTAIALTEHPQLNATLSHAGESGTPAAIIEHEAVHMGMAVDTERGLFVPVVRNVQAKSIQEIAAESAALIEQTRTGSIAAAHLRGSTFTLTNLGMYDIDAFTPIINLPECAILGIGRIVAKVVVIDEATETTAIRKRMALSLTFDHRVVDGAPAARFLQRVARFIENPSLWLIR